MGWQDRDYSSDSTYYSRQGGFGGPRPVFQGSGMGAYSMVTKIIIANAIVFFLAHYTQIGLSVERNVFGQIVSVSNWFDDTLNMQAKAVWHGQIWRLFTATYMHASGMHIFMNMFILYIFGPLLERKWGSKQFFYAYTLGGIAGNIVLALLGAAGILGWETYGLGASGSVWTVMAAAAIYFPNTEVLLYFLVPVRLWWIVAVYGIWFVYNILQFGENWGGDVCHLAGLVFGAWWAYTGGFPWAGGNPAAKARFPRAATAGAKSVFDKFAQTKPGRKQPTARERIKQRQVDAKIVDEILAKVYDKGIHCLTPEEREKLQEATLRQKEDEARHK